METLKAGKIVTIVFDDIGGPARIGATWRQHESNPV